MVQHFYVALDLSSPNPFGLLKYTVHFFFKPNQKELRLAQMQMSIKLQFTSKLIFNFFCSESFETLICGVKIK